LSDREGCTSLRRIGAPGVTLSEPRAGSGPPNVPVFSGEGQREREARAASFVRCKPKLARPSEDDIDPGKNCRESRARNFSHAPLENLSVERNDLGNVGNGRLCEAGIARRK